MKAKVGRYSYSSTNFIVQKDDKEFQCDIFAARSVGVRVIARKQNKRGKQYYKDFREMIFLNNKNTAIGKWE